MTTIIMNESTFQVEPFVRYKENRIKGHFTQESLPGRKITSLTMAIVKISSLKLTMDSVLAQLKLKEVWGFVLNDSGGVLSTFVTLRFNLSSIDPGQIYQLNFVPFKTDIGTSFMVNGVSRNPLTNIEKFALEAANDILNSEINFCHDEKLNQIVI